MTNYDSDIRLSVDLDGTQVENTAQELGRDVDRIFTQAGRSQNLSIAFKNLLTTIDRVSERARNLQQELAEFHNIPPAQLVVDQEYQALVTQLNQVNNQLVILRERAQSAGEIPINPTLQQSIEQLRTSILKTIQNLPRLTVTKLVSGFKTLSTNINKTVTGFNKLVGSSILNGIKKLGSAISNLGKRTSSSNGVFDKGFRNFIRYGLGVRSLFALINKLRRALFEGFGDLAQVHEPFNRAMSNIISALTQLRNSFASAFAPIIETVEPILTLFINKVSQAVSAVGQLIAALTGKEFVKAGAVQKDYAESVAGSASSANKAAKATNKQTKEAEKLKKTLAGFDDVEILKAPDESDTSADTGDTGGAGDLGFSLAPVESAIKGFADKIKEAWNNADFYDIGRIVGNKIKEALEKIPWTEIKGLAWQIAKSFATFLNGFFETPGLFDAIGSALAEALNTALVFLNTFLLNFHFDSFAKAIADGLNAAVRDFNWEMLGDTLVRAINGVFTAWYTFVSTFDFKKFGERIGDSISRVIRGVNWTQGGASLAKTINGIFDALNGFISSTDWKSLGKAVVDFISGYWKDFDSSKVSNFISNVWIAFFNFLTGALEEVDWESLPSTILSQIKNYFTGFKWDETAEAVGRFIGAAFKANIAAGSSLLKTMKEFGKSILEGGYEGIKEKIKSVAAWIKEHIVDPFVRGFKSVFGIASPAKIMKPLGENIIEGLFSGITETFKDIKTWINDNIVTPFVEGVRSMFGLDGEESKLIAIGKELMTGLMSGITEKISGIDDWIGDNVTGPFLRFIEEKFGIKGKESEVFSEYGQDVIGGLQSGIKNNSDAPVTELSTMHSNMTGIFSGSTENWKTLGQNLLSLGLNPGINGFVSVVESSVSGLESKLRGIFTDKNSDWETSGSELISNLNNGITDKSEDAEQAVGDIADDMNDRLSGYSTLREFRESGQDIVGAIEDGLEDENESITGLASDLAEDIGDQFSKDEFEYVGANIGEGIYDGLFDEMEYLKTLAWNVAVAMFNEAKAALGISSPSKKFAWIAKMTMQGLGNGIVDNEDTAISAISDVADAMEKEAENANPTITLSNSINDWIDSLDEVLSKFGELIEKRFDLVINSTQQLDKLLSSVMQVSNLSSYGNPYIAQGKIIPSTMYAGTSMTNDINSLVRQLNDIGNRLVSQEDLQEIVATAIRENARWEMYLGDEQLARHVRSGNLKLSNRYNTIKQTI